jgi:SPP1 family predicted phage head-tail adaptor
MRAGDLRRRVIVQKRTTTQDTFGQQATTWSDVLTGVPADIQPLSGRELVVAQAVNAAVTHQITMRWHPLLADPVAVAAMRVKYVTPQVTRYFNVAASLNVDERNKTIELSAIEGENPGG